MVFFTASTFMPSGEYKPEDWPACQWTCSLQTWKWPTVRALRWLLLPEAEYYDAATTMSEAVRTMMRMDAEAAQETPAQAEAGVSWDFWDPPVRGTEILGQKRGAGVLL